MLVMRPRRVEELVYGEKVDVAEHDQECGGIRPEEDEDRYDRVGSRGFRLRPTSRMCPFNLSREPCAGPSNVESVMDETFGIGFLDAFALANGRR